ncbi:MAG: type III-B CRISPR module-associated protein Cmr3 [Myxococcales bacterium]|nr:type III-B CRISPR module-associated protein Cmr3 [Myxococcales bacterium]
MSHYLIDPRDPLVLRDGRASDTEMRTLPFPWPSTTTGCLRTLTGTSAKGRFELSTAEALRIPVAGPLLADEQGNLLPPSPADCLWNRPDDAPAGDETQVERRRLAPLDALPAGAAYGADGLNDLKLLAPTDNGGEMPKAKAASAPAFWRWSDFARWLQSRPTAMERCERSAFLAPLPVERRIHVKIDAETQTAEDGMLFSTQAVVFAHGKERFQLAVRCPDERLARKVPDNGVAVHVGGKRRLSFLRPATARWPDFGTVFPNGLEVGAGRIARIILLTPGLFEAGWRPSDAQLGGQLIAAAVGRPQVISGWGIVEKDPDDRSRGQFGPKAIRRMAPAGSVYWVRLPDGVDPNAWARARWFQGVCDTEQDRLDGFGLCVVGVE